MSTPARVKLSPYSQIFLNEWKINPERSDYNIVFDQELFGKVDPYRLDSALKRFIKDYLVTHSRIEEKDGEYYWVEDDNININLEYCEHLLNEQDLIQYAQKPFDLEKGYLLRAKLIKISTESFRFLVVIHHIIMDAIKGYFFVDAISDYYNNGKYRFNLNLQEQKEKIYELNSKLEERLIKNKFVHQRFWRGVLKNTAPIDLRFLKPPSTFLHCRVENLIAEYKFSFDSKVLEKINQLKKKYLITPYLFGQAVFAILLHRYTKQSKIGISYPVAIKDGAHFMYGAHINTNIISYKFSYKTTVLDILEAVKTHFQELKANEHNYYPIQDIMPLMRVTAILDVGFIQTNLKDKSFYFEGVAKVKINNTLDVDLLGKLVFEQEVTDSSINIKVKYRKEYVDEKLLLTFVETYRKLFVEILDDLLCLNKKNISTYNIFYEKQHQLLVLDWNKTLRAYPSDKTIHKLLEEQVVITPNNIAIIYKDIKLTYAELNEQANQLAYYLIENYQVKPDDLIALCLDRSQLMLVAILAVLKSGGAYVPIDPHYPEQRINYILEDTKAKAVLINEIHQNKISNAVPQLVINSRILKTELLRQKNTNPIAATKSKHLAYVIYTSGTTGSPKGVMVEHNSLTSLITNFIYYPFSKKDSLNTLSTTNYTFDVFALEYLLPLLNGYRIELVDLTKLTKKLNLNQYNFIQITPSKLELLIKQINYDFKIENEHTVSFLVGGEALNQGVVNSLYELEQHLTAGKQNVKFKLINVYGPTETTVWSTAAFLNKAKAVTIGRPLSNQTVYVLDNHKTPCPLGAVGELYIGGAGLARGYLNQPELTKERFINNPFQTEEEKQQGINARLYKTGDLVRWLPDGNLEYIGRSDFQVKIRGHRVELGEIEKILSLHPKVKQNAVLLKENQGNKYLVSYYISDNKVDDQELQSHLAQYLPDYMLPNIFIHLDKLPLTSSGKLDRKNLPDPAFNHVYHYLPPTNKQEQIVCEAFAKVLGLEKVGIEDDFFKIGGDSIKAISFVSNLQTNFKINVADVFNLKTPKKIAVSITFEKDNLRRRLEFIKSIYKANKNYELDFQLKVKILEYQGSLKILPKRYAKKPIKTVLLTGATGYLGANLLNQLLTLTDYKIFLLVRADSNDVAFKRVNQKFQFYFDKILNSLLNKRIFVFAADLEKSNLGLSAEDYQLVVEKVDSIIHSAALTKHYGEAEKFYAANVQATTNLLELSALTNLKDFHYISTASVLDNNHIAEGEHQILTEDDFADKLGEQTNVYIQTKYEGEKQVVKYWKKKITGNIYRVGNLAFIASNYRTQENIEDNGFYNKLKCLLQLQIAAREIGQQEISPVDLTAQAIVTMFDKKHLDGIYHVFNPYFCNMAELFLEDGDLSVNVLTIDKFIDAILDYLDKSAYAKLVERFLLHQGWLEEDWKSAKPIQILQTRTQAILKRLGFEWPTITPEMFSAFIEEAYSYRKVREEEA